MNPPEIEPKCCYWCELKRELAGEPTRSIIGVTLENCHDHQTPRAIYADVWGDAWGEERQAA